MGHHSEKLNNPVSSVVERGPVRRDAAGAPAELNWRGHLWYSEVLSADCALREAICTSHGGRGGRESAIAELLRSIRGSPRRLPTAVQRRATPAVHRRSAHCVLRFCTRARSRYRRSMRSLPWALTINSMRRGSNDPAIPGAACILTASRAYRVCAALCDRCGRWLLWGFPSCSA